MTNSPFNPSAWTKLPYPEPSPEDIALAKAIWVWWTECVRTASRERLNAGLNGSPAILGIHEIYASPPAHSHGQRAVLRALSLLLRTKRVIAAPSDIEKVSPNTGQKVAVFFHSHHYPRALLQCRPLADFRPGDTPLVTAEPETSSARKKRTSKPAGNKKPESQDMANGIDPPRHPVTTAASDPAAVASNSRNFHAEKKSASKRKDAQGTLSEEQGQMDLFKTMFKP